MARDRPTLSLILHARENKERISTKSWISVERRRNHLHPQQQLGSGALTSKGRFRIATKLLPRCSWQVVNTAVQDVASASLTPGILEKL
jgi:hypothetical protein